MKDAVAMKRHPSKPVRVTPRGRSALTVMQPAPNAMLQASRPQGNDIEMDDADSSEDAVMTSVNEGDTNAAGQVTAQGADIEMQDLSLIFQPRLVVNPPGTPSTQPSAVQPQLAACRLCALLAVTRNLHAPDAFPPAPANYLSAAVQGRPQPAAQPAPVCRLCASLAAQSRSQAAVGTTFANSLAFTVATAASQPFGSVG